MTQSAAPEVQPVDRELDYYVAWLIQRLLKQVRGFRVAGVSFDTERFPAGMEVINASAQGHLGPDGVRGPVLVLCTLDGLHKVPRGAIIIGPQFIEVTQDGRKLFNLEPFIPEAWQALVHAQGLLAALREGPTL